MNKLKEKSVRRALTVGDIPRTMSKEQAKRICSVMNEIRTLIDKAHTTRKCDICRAKGKEDVEIVPSRDDEDLCRECRQRLTGREQANCCVECGAYEKEMHGEKCKYCWASSLKKKTLDKRDSRTCERCKGEMRKHKPELFVMSYSVSFVLLSSTLFLTSTSAQVSKTTP